MPSNAEEKLDQVLDAVARLDQAIQGRGGMFERLEAAEAKLSQHESLVGKGVGVAIILGLLASFVTKEIGDFIRHLFGKV